MLNPKQIISIILLTVVIFSGWLFFWPLIECWYALSLEPLISNGFKLMSFIVGAIIFFPVTFKLGIMIV